MSNRQNSGRLREANLLHAGAEAAGGPTRDSAPEEELRLVQPAEIQVLGDHLLCPSPDMGIPDHDPLQRCLDPRVIRVES